MIREKERYESMAMASAGAPGNGGRYRRLLSDEIQDEYPLEDHGEMYGHMDGGLYGGCGPAPAAETSIGRYDLLGDGAVPGGGWTAGDLLSGGRGCLWAWPCAADPVVFPAGRASSDDGGGVCGAVSGGSCAVPEGVQKALDGKKLSVSGGNASVSGVPDADGFHGGPSSDGDGNEGLAAGHRRAGVCRVRHDGWEECSCGTAKEKE